MNTRIIQTISLVITILFISTAVLPAQELKSIQLPQPQTQGGRPLMQVLKDRKSSREFSSKKLPMQILSNLLWAAWGINRPETSKRTAPSAMNKQEIDIYVSTAEGLYLYNAKAHTLEPVLAQDIRVFTGGQSFVKDAPLNLIYVADFSRMGDGAEDQKIFYSATDTGFISQNVYLYCASQGLATVVRGWVDKPTLEKKMELRSDQKVILTQTVGYPK